MILIEEQRTNFLLHSDKPKTQHFNKSLGTLCISYRKGFCFATQHPLWKVWRWRYIKSMTVLQAPFTLIPVFVRKGQVEDGICPTSYIETGLTPTTRAADRIVIPLKEMFGGSNE